MDLLEAGATDEELAHAAAEEARLVLQKATLRAPFDGTVGDVTVRKGETAAPGVPVVIIGDLKGLHGERLNDYGLGDAGGLTPQGQFLRELLVSLG